MDSFEMILFALLKRRRQGEIYGLSKAHRLPREGVSVNVIVEYMGRVLFAHEGNVYAPAPAKSVNNREGSQ